MRRILVIGATSGIGRALVEAALGQLGPGRALALWGMGVKAGANGMVIVLNYLLSKTIIFRPKG